MPRLADLAGRALSPWAQTLSGEGCLFPYYHMVSDTYVPHVSPLYRFRSSKEFKRDLEYFLQARRAVSLDEFIRILDLTGAPPPRSFLLTFDDGFREMSEVVSPILRALGIPATFFIISGVVGNRAMCVHQKISLLLDCRLRRTEEFPNREVQSCLNAIGIHEADAGRGLRRLRWENQATVNELGRMTGIDFSAYANKQRPFLSEAQIEELLRQGFHIGAHSIDHPLYANLALAEQLRQTRESIEYIVGRFQPRHRVFAFPHTDRGVTPEFFQEAFLENQLSVTFGTSAPATDSVPRSFQRFSMEKTSARASAIVGRNILRKLKLRATGRSLLSRSGAPARVFA